MTKDEADMLIAYYESAPSKIVAMKRKIGVNHPAVRYIEALELSLKYAEADAQAITDEEDEQIWAMARAQGRKLRGEQ